MQVQIRGILRSSVKEQLARGESVASMTVRAQQAKQVQEIGS